MQVVTLHLARHLKPRGPQGSPGMLQGGIWEPSGGIQTPWAQPNTVPKVKRAPMQANTTPVQPNAGPVQPNAAPVQPNAIKYGPSGLQRHPLGGHMGFKSPPRKPMELQWEAQWSPQGPKATNEATHCDIKWHSKGSKQSQKSQIWDPPGPIYCDTFPSGMISWTTMQLFKWWGPAAGAKPVDIRRTPGGGAGRD